MTKQNILSLALTLVLGIVAGVYLYIVGFAPTYLLDPVDTATEYSDLVVVVDAYGSCEETRTCLTFQLRADGTYRALLSGDISTVREGSLTRSLTRRVSAVLVAESLQPNTALLATRTCRFGETGTNYRVLITRDSVNYLLDTCTTDIKYDGEVWSILVAVMREIAAEFS